MTKRMRLGLTLLCLTPLCGCSTTAPPRIEVVRQAPPAALLAPVPEPVPPANGAANGDLLAYTLELQAALHDANADKSALTELYKDQ
ncbi:Rz1-like lysis system protein LysC [uncultured Desulfovibrio sp.]|uniref:Rz1-like lysis system protein LysC n=2 Tax=uncultured Desulfovibrio sp. TaxID=167968 RepID=UPI0034C6A9B3